MGSLQLQSLFVSYAQLQIALEALVYGASIDGNVIAGCRGIALPVCVRDAATHPAHCPGWAAHPAKDCSWPITCTPR